MPKRIVLLFSGIRILHWVPKRAEMGGYLIYKCINKKIIINGTKLLIKSFTYLIKGENCVLITEFCIIYMIFHIGNIVWTINYQDFHLGHTVPYLVFTYCVICL